MVFQAKTQAKIVVLSCAPGAAVARVLDEVVREEDLAAGLVPVQVVHAHVRVRAVGAAGEEERQSHFSFRASNPLRFRMAFAL